jgi:outer membrane immunogenic protein
VKKSLLLPSVATAFVALTNFAQAADMPVKAPPMAPPPVLFTWTGFYLGGNLGGAWAHRDWDDVTRNITFGQSGDGRFIAGGQVGFNWQINGFVLGVEADADWISRNNGNGVGVVIPGIVGPIAISSDHRWITTAAARFGFAVDHTLFYGKVGGGWIGTSDLTVTNLTTGASFTGSGSSSRGGLCRRPLLVGSMRASAGL